MVDSVDNKFGRVFVRKAENVADKGTKDDYFLLEGAKFCNLQLKIIPGSSSQKDYKGHKFSFGVLGQKLDAFFPLGMNIIKSKKELAIALIREIDVARKLNLITGEEGSEEYTRKCSLIKKTFGAYFTSVVVPENDYMEDDFGHLINMYIHMDDTMESFKDAESNNNVNSGKDRRKCSYKTTCQIAQALSEAMRSEDPENEDPFRVWLQDPTQLLKNVNGEQMDFGKLTLDQIDDLGKLLHTQLSLMSSIRKAAIEIGVKNKCSPRPLLSEISRLICGIGFEYSQEWNCSVMSEANWKLMLPTMNFQRLTTVAILIFFEPLLLHRGISLPDKVRQSSLFQLIYYHLNVHCIKTDDLLSFRKEMEGDGNEWRNNEACILYKTGQMTECEAMAKMAQDANHAKDQMEILGEVLIKTWKGSQEERQVENFVLTLKRFVEAYTRWFLMIDRYHENIVADCFIDE